VNTIASAFLKALMIFGLLLAMCWPAQSYPIVANSAAVVSSTIQIFGDGFEQAEEEGPPVFSCDHPDVRPSWMTGTVKTWAKLFMPRDGSPVPTYPNGLGFPIPLGASKSAWEAGWFVALEDQTTTLFWEPAQAKPNEGYYMARPAKGMFVSISPCEGDLRPSSFVATDFLAPGCRRYANTGSITTTTKQPASTFGYCALVAGQKYYLNVSPVNPNDGLTPGEHSCQNTAGSLNGCDAQAKQSAN
jgi:hypothetical protein